MASSRQKKRTPGKKKKAPRARKGITTISAKTRPTRSNTLPAAPVPARPQPRLLKNIKIERISFVSADDPSVEPVVIWQLPRGPGRPRSITLEAFQKDLAAHPDETIYRRAKRLGIDRQTVKDRLKEARDPKARVPFELRGPIVLIK